MEITNNSKATILANQASMADTPFKRIKGLLGRKTFNSREALIIKPCNSIHTFFVHFPIDVLFVNKQNQVIKTLSFLMPFRLTRIYFGAAFVVELPAGTIQSTRTTQGDTISIK